MKKHVKLCLLLLLMVSISGGTSIAQNARKGSTKQSKANKAEFSGVIQIKATEKGNYKYDLDIDFGLTKEGKKKVFAKTEKEKANFDKVIKSGSLVEALNFFMKRGFSINTSYAVGGKQIIHYYTLSPAEGTAKTKATAKQKKQNKPKISPEELEKRRLQKEQRMKEQNK